MKATGLAAGKGRKFRVSVYKAPDVSGKKKIFFHFSLGVIVSDNREAACKAARDILTHKAFGDAGSEVVVEEKLEGPEVSVLCFCDGTTVVPMPAAQDYKRIGEGDTGLNTGGMGAYVPVHSSILDKERYDEIVGYVGKTASSMREAGCRYVGILYAGVMLTKDGPKFLEYNCRFGDPETEVSGNILSFD